jgi:hypothetical protein
LELWGNTEVSYTCYSSRIQVEELKNAAKNIGQQSSTIKKNRVQQNQIFGMKI